jgi:hypothetical protein
MVHGKDERSAALEKLGAEVVVGDLLEINTIRTAMEGVDAAYFCWPVKPGLIHAIVNFAQAAKEAGVSTIINLSQRSANRNSTMRSAGAHLFGFEPTVRGALPGPEPPVATAADSRRRDLANCLAPPFDDRFAQIFGPVNRGLVIGPVKDQGLSARCSFHPADRVDRGQPFDRADQGHHLRS